jgi:hypothetical protein
MALPDSTPSADDLIDMDFARPCECAATRCRPEAQIVDDLDPAHAYQIADEK